jgi:Domain of unknown function (DUF4190)
MADPERDPTPEQQPAASPAPPSAADDVTQQVPTQQTPQPPPTQQIPEWGPQQQGNAQQDYGYGYGTPSYGAGGYNTPAYSGGGYPAQPGYGYAPPQTEPLAIWGLVTAILAWVACPIPFVPAIVALVLAGNAQRNIEASGGTKEGRGINTATKILAWINIGMWALIAIFVVVAIVASAAANA